MTPLGPEDAPAQLHLDDELMAELRRAHAYVDEVAAQMQRTIDAVRGRADAAERERDEARAQVAALREVLDSWGHDVDCVVSLVRRQSWPTKHPRPCDCNLADVLSDTAAAAAEHDARVKDAALEEAARLIEQDWEHELRVAGLTQAIRALKGKR